MVLLFILPIISLLFHAIVFNVYVWKLSSKKLREHKDYQNSYLYFKEKWKAALFHKILNCFGPRATLLAFIALNLVYNIQSVAICLGLYKSKVAHAAFILVVIIYTAFTAGTYYGSKEQNSLASKNKVVPSHLVESPRDLLVSNLLVRHTPETDRPNTQQMILTHHPPSGAR